MAKRRKKITFTVTDAFSKSRRPASTPGDVAEILWRAYARQTTGEKVPGIKALSNPIKFKDVRNLDVSVSMLFGQTAANVVGLPNIKKLKTGTDTDLKNIVKGIRLAILFLTSTKKLQPILKAAFTLTITERLTKRWRAKGGSTNFGKQTVGSTGRSANKGEGQEPVGGTGALQSADVIAQRTLEFKQAGAIIEGLLTDPNKLVVQGKFVGLRSLREFTQLAVKSSSSPFRSVFLMLEFGTGRFARPTNLIRRFSGSARTKYKVPPFVAGQIRADTASWFNFGRAASMARKIQKKGKFTTNASEIFLRSVVLPGRRPRHIIFQERGIARELTTAKKQALKEVIRLINEAVSEKHPGWGALVLKKVNIPFDTSFTIVL